jgi:hypothetical protein
VTFEEVRRVNNVEVRVVSRAIMSMARQSVALSCGGRRTRLPLFRRVQPRLPPLHQALGVCGAITLTERGRPVNTAIRRASVLLEGIVGA